ncbi:VolA/Pla-1 family phospholipase [Vibrio sp. TRT 21S02]|uniref:VolA/Pla-1 family phospholipase n=1 Tax=Vibrio sp. TRT 21S02 TaxID=3418507 RepID=UPI003CED213D
MKLNTQVTLLAAALLSGCGDDTSSTTNESQYESHIEAALARSTGIKFTLQGENASVPLPSYTLMNTSDATLEIPTGGDDSLTNPLAAMGTMDGWSTTMPLIMNFEGTGLADGVVAQGIYLVELTDSLLGNPTPKRILTQNVDFIALADAASDTITIQMLNSDLTAKGEYILAITDEVTDVNGDPVGTSGSYAAIKTKLKSYGSETLQTLQQVTHGTEALFAATGIDSEHIIYSTWFSTQSVGETLYAVKGATASALGSGGLAQVWRNNANPNNVDLTMAHLLTVTSTQSYKDALDADSHFDTYMDPDGAGLKATLKAEYDTDGLNVNVSKGTVQLPYFLETGNNWNSQPFESAMPSLALIKQALEDSTQQATIASQLTAAGIDATKLTEATEQLKLVGLNLTKSDGSRLDSDRHLTRYSPIPKIKSLQPVEFLLFTPNGAASNWPVVIYQHGITSSKEDAYFHAGKLANQGLAVIAIDLPLHGARSLDSSRSANADITAYLNLTNLPVARDNVRQSALDVMALRASLTYSQLAGVLALTPLSAINTLTTPPRFVGHSLGGIVGVPAVGAANRVLDGGSADTMYKFSSISTANSGGQIANLLLGSEKYGPLIKHSIAFTASSEYQAFANGYCASLDASACYTLFDNMASDADKAALESGFNQFAYATQTVLDTVDPYSNASYLTDGTSPTIPAYLMQVQGDESVPNSVAQRPFAGTIPLATKLGMKTVTQADSALSNTKDFVSFSNIGAHSTFLFPQDSGNADEPMHDAMLDQLSDFVLDNNLSALTNAGLLE